MNFVVVINDEDQYSVWATCGEIPAGWRAGGFIGPLADCLSQIESVWTDMRPRRLRQAMGSGGDVRLNPLASDADSRASGTALHTLVMECAELNPDAKAVTVGGESVTYAELIERARLLAAGLIGAGAGTDTFIGVCVDRSLDAVVGLLGTLMSGAAYVPMAVDLPTERARSVIADAGIRIMTGASVERLWALTETAVPVGDLRSTSASGNGANAAAVELPEVHPAQAAYAIFTSGSTGRPKGVVVSHEAVVNSTLARFRVFPSKPMNYLMLAPLTFDAAVAGLYFSLAAGGHLVIPTREEVLDSSLLAELAAREAVTHLDGVGSQYAAILAYHPETLAKVRCVIVAGEPLPSQLVREHFAVAPTTALFNEYGPTEGTVWSTVHDCSPSDEGPLAPIGRAIEGVQVTVRDQSLASVPMGETGEICISGKGLARGYLRNPAMTAQRFVPDPDHPGDRLYRTGDLGWFGREGVLVYRGRADQMVKVRGFRVELGEVEARLREHPSVAAAAVLAYEGTVSTCLAAVLTPRAGHSLRAQALCAFVAETLPDYMIPTTWRLADRFPLTSHGKVDRALLQATWSTVGTSLAR